MMASSAQGDKVFWIVPCVAATHPPCLYVVDVHGWGRADFAWDEIGRGEVACFKVNALVGFQKLRIRLCENLLPSRFCPF
jgi:hypothetical protein